jgi:hypothetical protein
MAETKEEIAAERDRLRADNENLRGQLTAAGTAPAAAGRAQAPQHTFQLSEGDRQELEAFGVVNIGGRLMTKADVEQAIAERGDGSQSGVEIADPADGSEAAARAAQADARTAEGRGAGIRGVDYVYPSVAPGLIDPAVAGVAGINGPAAPTGKA